MLDPDLPMVVLNPRAVSEVPGLVLHKRLIGEGNRCVIEAGSGAGDSLLSLGRGGHRPQPDSDPAARGQNSDWQHGSCPCITSVFRIQG
jgi:hypothetical protein